MQRLQKSVQTGYPQSDTDGTKMNGMSASFFPAGEILIASCINDTLQI